MVTVNGETTTMMVVHSSRPCTRAISYVYLLVNGLGSRQYTCSSFSLTYSNVGRFGHQHRHNNIKQAHQRYSTKPLSSSKLLEDTNLNKIDASKKWDFVLAGKIEEQQDENRDENDATIRNILVCGDGDLSYSAEIAPELDTLGIELYATVLEEESTHNTGKPETYILNLRVHLWNICNLLIYMPNLSCSNRFFFSYIQCISILHSMQR